MKNRRYIFVFILVAINITGFAQLFTKIIPQNAIGLYYSHAEWLDFDNDGDLDFLITGAASTNDLRTLLYENLGNDTFRQALVPFNNFPQYAESEISFINTNFDDRIDVILMGRRIGANVNRISLLENRTSGFVDVGTLPNFGDAQGYGTISVGDVNNDGTSDIFVSGINGFVNGDPTVNAFVYLNKNGVYVKSSSIFKGLYESSSKLADIDNDGDLDIIICGRENAAPFQNTQIYLNDGVGNFGLAQIQLLPLQNPSIDLADYDADNDLDILLTGFDQNLNKTSKLYNNNKNVFTEIVIANLSRTVGGTATWGDYDNDGDFDILITGKNDGSPLKLSIFQNNGGNQFLEINESSFEISSYGSASWGDYDSDGDLDILVSGETMTLPALYILRNETTKKNNKPNKPLDLKLTKINATSFSLSWNGATDDVTPAQSLTYNLSIRKTLTSENLLHPFSDNQTGKRRVAKPGNLWLNKHWKLRDLEDGTYSVKIQSIDGGLSASEWSDEKQFYAGFPSAPTGLSLVYVDGKIKLSWSDKSNNEQFFVIERRMNNGVYLRIDSVTSNTVTYSDSYNGFGLFEYRVNSVNPNQRSAYTNVVQTSLDPPSNLTFNFEDGKVKLNWRDNSYSEQFFVIERKSIGDFIKTDSVSANVSTYTFSGQQEGLYFYRVNAVNPAQKSSYSNTVEVLVTDLELDNLKPFDAYPTQTKEFLTIKLRQRGTQDIQVEILDTKGAVAISQTLLSDINGQVLIDTSTLVDGVYIFILKLPDGNLFFTRFMKK